MKIEGLDKLKRLIDRIEQREKYLIDKGQEEVDLKKFQDPVMGTFLHQDIFDADGKVIITEEESAEFERKHPEIFKYLQSIKSEAFRILEP